MSIAIAELVGLLFLLSLVLGPATTWLVLLALLIICYMVGVVAS